MWRELARSTWPRAASHVPVGIRCDQPELADVEWGQPHAGSLVEGIGCDGAGTTRLPHGGSAPRKPDGCGEHRWRGYLAWIGATAAAARDAIGVQALISASAHGDDVPLTILNGRERTEFRVQRAEVRG